MLDRVLEPEVMDSPRDAADYDSMDHGEVNRRFVADFLAVFRLGGAPLASGPEVEPSVCEILDVGTGTAQIPVQLCRQDSLPRIAAIDLAPGMLDLARRNVAEAGFADRIRLEQIDAKQLPYTSNRFAAVMSNSIVHHIPAPAVVLSEIVRVAMPGGLLFVRDLVRPPSAEALDRLVEMYAGGASRHQRQLFADSLRAALSLEEVRAMVEPLGCDPKCATLTSDRHWTLSARKIVREKASVRDEE
jgi:ubiquinone/menaquinone biosynthesis C-methylase UbiE